MIKMTRVIGISGSTCSGKTTLTKLLAMNVKNSVSISQDDYFYRHTSGKLEFLPEYGTYNLDSPRSIDFHRLVRDLTDLVESKAFEFIFVEGSLIFANDELYRIIDRKYFVCLDKEECTRRRRMRCYLHPDPVKYFEEYAWPEFLKYRQFCMHYRHDIIYIDGSKSIGDMLEYVINDIFNF